MAVSYTYLWDFGDGTTSTEEDPVHIYASPGIYTVTLTATNSCTSETETKVDYVTVYQGQLTPYKTNKSFTLGMALEE